MNRVRACVLVGLAVAGWAALGSGTRATTNARTTADEPHYLMTALSLASDLDLDVADERARGAYRDFHEVGLPTQEAIQRDGSRVSPHNPLLPALLAVPVAGLGWLGAKLALAAVAGALAGLTLFVAEARLGVPRRLAVPIVLAAGGSAPLAVYATQVYPEIVAALAVVTALAIVTTPAARRSHAVALVAAVSVLPWLSVKYAPVAAALGLVALIRWPARRVVLATAAGVSGIVFAVAHLRWYGGLTPYAVGHHFADGQLDVMGEPAYGGRAARVVGLFVDRDFGIAIWQPMWLLAVPAFATWVRRDRQRALVLGVPALAGWLNASFVALTMHGWWFPGRQVVVVLPCLVLAIASFARHVSIPAWVWWFAAGLGGSISAWLAVQVYVTDTRLITTFADLTHPWWVVVRSVLPDLRADRPIDGFKLLMWTVALAAVVVRPTPRRSNPSRAPVGLVAPEPASPESSVPQPFARANVDLEGATP